MTKSEVIRKVRLAVNEYGMLDGAKRVLVGYSGGADSAALLTVLLEMSRTDGFSLYAVHVNHMIRGAEADRDMRACEEYCRRIGVELFIYSRDILALAAQSGASVEEAARAARYEIFGELCRMVEIDRVATAHNSDDNIETVLINLIRGTGTKGLSGIPCVRDNIIRPLIYCSKEEVIAFCREKKIPFVTDSTNNDDVYTRNFIRHKIVPQMKELNPSVGKAILRSGRLLRCDAEYLDSTAAAGDTDDAVALSRMSSAVSGRIIMRRYAAYCGGVMSEVQTRAVQKLLAAGVEYSSVSLSGEITAYLSAGKLCFSDEPFAPPKFDFVYPLVMGLNRIEETGDEIRVCRGEKDIKEYKNIYKLFIYAQINSDKINGNMYVRTRRSGDRYVYGGMTRKLKKLFSDRKIPLDERERLPLICDESGIIWAPGFPVRDGMFESDPEKRLYIIIEQRNRQKNED